MRILFVHNFYQQPGGEDQVFADEAELLKGRGHQVDTWTADNDAIAGMGRLTLAAKTVWNAAAHDQLLEQVRRLRPALVHFHNTFPLLSPAVYSAARQGGAAVVQTLHNYRLLCPNAVFFRDGKPCEDCLGKQIAWPAAVRGCYRGSRSASAVTTLMLAAHRLRGTFHDDVDAFICLTEFAREKFIAGGLPAQRLMIKPNFVPDFTGTTASTSAGQSHHRPYLLFVGRLSQGKGINLLLQAWRQVRAEAELKIVGDGEEAAAVRAAAAADSRITWLGQRPIADVYGLMSGASALIFPSLWYECQPKTVIESLAASTPVIASDRGAAASMVADGMTGHHFAAGDATALAAAITAHLALPPHHHAHLRSAARQAYLAQYTPEKNYIRLMEIYRAALDRRFTQAAA